MGLEGVRIRGCVHLARMYSPKSRGAGAFSRDHSYLEEITRRTSRQILTAAPMTWTARASGLAIVRL